MGVEALIAELKEKIAVEGPGSLSRLLEEAVKYLQQEVDKHGRV